MCLNLSGFGYIKDIKEKINKESYSSISEIPEYYLHNIAMYHYLWEIGIRINGATVEIGEPAKLAQRVLVEGWKTLDLIRGPMYRSNKFLDDKLILEELLGARSTDKRQINMEFRSSNRASMELAKKAIIDTLKDNRFWRYPFIETVSLLTNNCKDDFAGKLSIYDPKSLLRYIYLYSVDKDPLSLLPRAVIDYESYNTKKRRVEYIRCIGIYEKTHSCLGFNEIMEKYYCGDSKMLKFSATYDGYNEKNIELAYDIGMECTVYRVIYYNYFPVFIGNGRYIAPEICNEGPYVEIYDSNKEEFIPCESNSEIYDLSFKKFIEEEPSFMKELHNTLLDTETDFFGI